MSNANRDYVIVYDVKNSSLVSSRPLSFYITDKNTSNIFVKLVTKVSVENGIDQYTDIENASNYVLTMRVIKPSNEVKSFEATQHEEGSIFQFDLTEDFKDIPGKYICELTISTIVNSRQELITSDPFSYEVKRSILSNVGEIIETEDTTIEKLLNDLETTKTELSSQIKEIANEKTIINLNSFNGDTITEKFKNAIKYGGNYSIFFTGTIEINDTINVSDNTRLNLIGNPDGRKNKSIIKFTPLDDKPMFLGENFQEGKNPTDKLYFNMKNVTIQTNKNNGQSKNTLFKGVRILESTFDSVYINNFNKILSSCSLGYLSRFINCNVMEIGRAFFADNTICGDTIITGNYFSGNSSMPVVENEETTYRCPDFCDNDSSMGAFSKNIISNNWFEKFGKIFKDSEKLTICGNVFDYIYTLGEISDSTFTGNLVTNIYKDNFLEQFKKYGNPHNSFIFPNYIFSAVDSNSIICNNKFDTIIDEYTKGYKLGGGKNFSNRKKLVAFRTFPSQI